MANATSNRAPSPPASALLPSAGASVPPVGLARQTVLLASLCLADLVLTLYLVELHGWGEGNPLMAAVLELGTVPFITVKLLSFVPALALAEWYRRRRPGRIEALIGRVALMYVVIYVVGFLAVNLPPLLEIWRLGGTLTGPFEAG